jgi:hypothetical protein
MSEENKPKEDFKVTMGKGIEVKPAHSTIINEGIPTLAADYVKCITDQDTGLCTLMFFKKHFLPTRRGDGAFVIDRTMDEGFLEVKVPMNTMFALALYMTEELKIIRAKPNSKGFHFGPSIIKEEKT